VKQKLNAIVSEMAKVAMALGADSEDTAGIVKSIVQSADLDLWAWYAVCREIEARTAPRAAKRIGFIYPVEGQN
jgi:hypothetical protein